MKEELAICLFDVDGVLIEPRAYRVGITKTLQFLSAEAGILNRLNSLPEEWEIAHMEACGLHDVWDITNIAFGLILMNTREVLTERLPEGLSSSLSVPDKLNILKELRPEITKPDYAKFADKLSVSHGSTHLPDIALAILSDKFAHDMEQSNKNDVFWLGFLQDFLCDTRSAQKNYGTRLFQNIILGSENFNQTYGLKSQYSGTSLLHSADKPIISSESVRLLENLSTKNNFCGAIYTARPSLPPADQRSLQGYSPEAEIAVASCGMQFVPLVGMGMMEWLSQKHGQRTEDLTKPNTTQALAALIAALKRTVDASILERAYQLDKALGTRLHLPELQDKKTSIYVFEDTISGVKPLKIISEKLKAAGCDLSLTTFGIAVDENKTAALAQECDKIFANINYAIDFVFAQRQLV